MFREWHQTQSSHRFLPHPDKIRKKTHLSLSFSILLLVPFSGAWHCYDVLPDQPADFSHPTPLSTDLLANHIPNLRYALLARISDDLYHAVTSAGSRSATKIKCGVSGNSTVHCGIFAVVCAQCSDQCGGDSKILLRKGLFLKVLSDRICIDN